MNLFVSKFINKIDKKGRISLPSIFRGALPKDHKNEIKIFANIKDEAAFIGQGYYFQIVNPSLALDLQNKSRMRLNLNKKTLGKILTGDIND